MLSLSVSTGVAFISKISSKPFKSVSTPDNAITTPVFSTWSEIPSLSLSKSKLSGMPSLSVSLLKQVKEIFPENTDLFIVLLTNLCTKEKPSIWEAKNSYGVLPEGVGLILKCISDPDKWVTPVSNIPSKLESTSKRLSGSTSVIFLFIGVTLTIKNSSSVISAIEVSSENFILTSSVNVKS